MYHDVMFAQFNIKRLLLIIQQYIHKYVILVPVVNDCYKYILPYSSA